MSYITKVETARFLLQVSALVVSGLFSVSAQQTAPVIKTDIPFDSIRLSDPFILADKKSSTYYMTGSGGRLWKSKDLQRWAGPFNVVKTDPNSWMGKNPAIWAAELHYYRGKYYYFATFTNKEVIIDSVNGHKIERRASHILVSENPDGPYIPMKDPIYLPANKPTLDGTCWIDKDGRPYMVYCHEWLQNNNGTIEKIQLKPDLSGTIGNGKILFRASESPWSREKLNGRIGPNRVTDGPWLFRTQTGKLGMLWTSWVYDVYTQGVAYSTSGTLDGPWVQEKEPITPPNHGHGMLFRDFTGKLLMSLHSHRVDEKGRYIRIPRLFEVDDSGDKLVVGKPYYPTALSKASVSEKVITEPYRFTSTGNPIITDKYTADPAALVKNDTLWLFAGHDSTGGQKGYKMKDWLVYSTTDLKNWIEYPVPLKITDLSWAKSGDAYAGQVIERKGKYYWYISTNWSGIGVAVANRPEGPYKDALGKPLLTNKDCFASTHSWACIDPAVFIDDDRQGWLFWGNRECYYAKLKENMIEIDGEIKKIDFDGFRFTEAPWISKRGEWYYLSYATGFPEKIAYAMSRNINGPWEYKGVLNEVAGNSNTNHQAILEYKGQWYFIYHNGSIQTDGGSFSRSVCIDRLFYNEDGTIKRIIMTSEGTGGK